VELDLRAYKANDSAERVLEVVLPRKRLQATIFLPEGSEPGEYDLQVLDSRRHAVASARSRAEVAIRSPPFEPLWISVP
jgi:hypothetical protein